MIGSLNDNASRETINEISKFLAQENDFAAFWLVS